MYAMTLSDSVRHWLGIDEVPTLSTLAALEQREVIRHQAVMGMLNRMEQRMINEHIGGNPRSFAPATLDWDTVQAMALAELERSSEKEK